MSFFECSKIKTDFRNHNLNFPRKGHVKLEIVNSEIAYLTIRTKNDKAFFDDVDKYTDSEEKVY